MSRFLDSGWISGKGPSPESGQALPQDTGSGTDVSEFTECLNNSLSVIWSDFWVALGTSVILRFSSNPVWFYDSMISVHVYIYILLSEEVIFPALPLLKAYLTFLPNIQTRCLLEGTQTGTFNASQENVPNVQLELS